MFDILTAIVLVLSGIYEGYRLSMAINSLSAFDLSSVAPDSAAYTIMENAKNNAVFEMIVCSVLLLLTVICIGRFIRLAIIGNIIYLTHNTTKDFIKTTNGSNSGHNSGKPKKPNSSGGMRITNSEKES